MRYPSSCSAGVTQPSRHHRALGPCADSYCLLLQQGRAAALCSATAACYLSSSPASQQREGKKSPATMRSSTAEPAATRPKFSWGRRNRTWRDIKRGNLCPLPSSTAKKQHQWHTETTLPCGAPGRPSAVSREGKPPLLSSHLQHLLCVSCLTEPALEVVCFHVHTESTWQLIS